MKPATIQKQADIIFRKILKLRGNSLVYLTSDLATVQTCKSQGSRAYAIEFDDPWRIVGVYNAAVDFKQLTQDITETVAALKR